MSLIISKIANIKIATKKNIKSETKKLATIKTVTKLLYEIDFSTEEVPLNNEERLVKLLTSLKGEKLNKGENTLISEIIE